MRSVVRIGAYVMFAILMIVGTFSAITEAFALLTESSTIAVYGGIFLLTLFAAAWIVIGCVVAKQWRAAFRDPGWFVLALAVAIGATGCTTVPPGHVGIKVEYYGTDRGVQSYPTVTGRVWYNPWSEDVLSWPTFVQTAKWTASVNEGAPVNEEITFTNADQMQIAADISVSYHILPEKVPAFYVKFRTDHMDQFTHGYMRNVARDMFDRFGGRYKIEQIMGDNAAFVAEVRTALEREVASIGIVIDQFGFIGAPRPPKAVTDAINEKAKAQQIATQKQVELIQTQADAAKEVARAEGHAKAVLTAAKAEAEANRMLSESLTDKLIALKQLEKWNGAYPQVTGGSTPLMQLK